MYSEPVDDSPGSAELYNLLKPTGMLDQQGLIVEEVSLTPCGSVRLQCSPVKYAEKEGFLSEIKGYQAKRGNRVRYDGKEIILHSSLYIAGQDRSSELCLRLQ